MPVSHNMSRGFYAYTSDDGVTYNIATTQENGTVNGDSPSKVPLAGLPTYPRGWVLRHVYGTSSAGDRTKVPVFDPASGLFTGSTTSFTKDGTAYTVEGKIGEKRQIKGG